MVVVCGRGRGSVVPAETAVAEPSNALPSGIVTFLFTDIEGSTKILKRLPDEAPEIFERHNEIVRAALGKHGGHEVGTDGDSFFVAFDNADNALATCAEIQAAIAVEDWPDGGTIRVRMGIHTGTAAPRGDNYVALAIHQAARVVSAAHGGQIIVERHRGRAHASCATRQPGRPRQVPGPRLRRTRVAPPTRSAERSRRRPTPPRTPRRWPQPRDASDVVRRPRARDREIAALLDTQQILTLVGPGGTGKTRLAIESALAAVDDWPDGVWLIALADLEDGSLVPTAIAEALGLAPSAADRWPDVIAWARDSRSLLVVDNVENHVAACAELLPQLIQHPGIAVMTTSREPLSVAGERQYRVDPLAVPAGDASESDVRRSPAVELFVDRATTRRSDFELDERAVADVARLCAGLDGLPLAIEIAAARVGVMGVPEILDGLHDRFGLLKSSDRTLPQRHRTMVDLLAWSYDLLDPLEQIAFRRLGVFAGSFTVAAAVAALVDDDLPADDVAELVWSLVDKSLVVADLTESGTRYRMLQTVESFAASLLADHGDDVATGRRAATALLARVGPWLTADRQWMGEVSIELANIRSLIARLTPARSGGRTATGLLARSLPRCGAVVSHRDRGGDPVDDVTPRTDVDEGRDAHVACRPPPPLRGDRQGRPTCSSRPRRSREDVGAPGMERCGGRSHPRRDPAPGRDARRGDSGGRSGAEPGVVAPRPGAERNLNGIARYEAGDMTGAFESLSRELAIYEQLGLEANIASAHGNLAELAMHLEHHAVAATHQQACLELALEIGQPVLIAFRRSWPHGSRLAMVDWVLAASACNPPPSANSPPPATPCIPPTRPNSMRCVRTRPNSSARTPLPPSCARERGARSGRRSGARSGRLRIGARPHA